MEIKIGEVTIDSEDGISKHMDAIIEKYSFNIDSCTTALVRLKSDQESTTPSIAFLMYDSYKNRNVLIKVIPIHTVTIDMYVDKYERKKTFWRRWKLEN